MLFSAISFVYYFLPIVLLVYFLVPKKFKNLVLLFSSLFFYFYGETVYILIMLTSSLSGYIHAIAIDKAKKANIKKAALISSIIVSAGLLCLFKYADFLIGNINALGFNVSLLKLPLPLGISFYTFQILSYIIDVYRMKTKAQYNIIDFTTYVTLFPQLIAGPIVRYITIEEQLKKRNHSFENIAYGIRRFIIGLSKKVLLANTLALFGQEFIVSEDKSVLFYWLYYILLALQIYFDFSGYSDMAIGLGRIFGFKLLENFNYPFISKSIAEFWRRWHISLFSWLRDYIYFPLGGNRVSKIKWLRNIFVVWFFTGLWHGAGWNFIMWGLF